MIELPSNIRFVPSYPQLVVPVSQTKYGNRAISTVEFADPYRTVDMETLPMKASEAVQLQAFIAAARGGMGTIIYCPTHICIPRAYWGDANNSHLSGSPSRGTVTNGYTVQLTGVVPGLQLMAGDLFSLKSGDYRQMLQVVTGATAVSTTLTVTVDQPIASYIALGATVRLRQPEMNTRLVKDSFQMGKGPRPVASFQLIEVPK
ncbi:hypothetical protein ACFOLL_12575 [Falsochrobactrum ovis]|uniref:Uncharacterized protein n=1 Tax=Falsochrobactrum ovis TaxID=1293442 RepID=A0A364JSW1_9HYPH|nr:hypothetical protein [Falsochrobactrum ovis]RAK26383.1 hypothetical protein C7374_11469 [Falsochrobactrum ovis]